MNEPHKIEILKKFDIISFPEERRHIYEKAWEDYLLAIKKIQENKKEGEPPYGP